MCGICGCDTHQEHTTHHHHPQTVSLEQNILSANQAFADANRETFANLGITAINLMSSPGSGKTTLLGKTRAARQRLPDLAVLVADLQTDCDATALRAQGMAAFQINTGQVCHLDAHAVSHAIEDIRLARGGILFIENVGNLVCPALFDLGQATSVVLLSVTEGDNKPLKYPQMFRACTLVLITKTDLIPHTDFDLEACKRHIHSVNPAARIMTMSARTGEGFDAWVAWLAGISR